MRLHALNLHENITLGGREVPAFSHPMESTGASSDDLIFRIPSRTLSQLSGGSAATI